MKNRTDDSRSPGPVLSVVVCTYNRADLLGDALKSLCEQTVETSRYELIVVDNNSRDNTREIIEGFCSRYPNVRYCLEEVQGLSHARNRGWREARGGYVAYVDDDCKVPDGYLAAALSVLDRLSPAVFGGPHYGYYNSPKPRWWKERYGSFEPSQTAVDLAHGDYLQGNNIILRRELLEATGGFDSRYGMVGEKIAYAEETELQKRVRSMWPDEVIRYDPKVYVWHLVRPEKMTLRWNVASYFQVGRYSFRLFEDGSLQACKAPRMRLLGRAVITTLRLLGGILLALVWRDRKRFPYLENYLYETSFMHIQTLGSIYGRCVDTA